MAREKVILAYSGGLDTSVAVKWINEKYDMDVITYTCDLGQGRELDTIKEKAIKTGAVEAIIEDVRNLFVDCFVWPALMTGTMYEGKYPLATALGRPLIAHRMVEFAKEKGATAVAHGCTGKGNDQVRFDVAFNTLAPELKIIAPVREWRFNRTQEIEYANEHGIEVDATKENIFSVDQNLWGRSVEAGVLENPWNAPPEAAYKWTVSPETAPDKPMDIEIEFEQGRPIALDGKEMDGVQIIEKLNELGGQHGVGRIDHVENRLVGIKSREIYEAPAAIILHEAHRELEFLTLSRQAQRFKTYVAQTCADIIYDGLWYSPFHQDLMGFVEKNQRFVSGQTRVKLYKGNCVVTGRKSPHSLYSEELATYEEGDAFPHEAATAFIKIHGMALKTQAQQQLLKGEPTVRPARIMPSKEGN
ncbi:MAG: argininosuccinate synthase [Planctomycetaceae bacterium]